MMFTHDDELRRQITTHVAAHRRTTVDLDGRRHAAVAIVVVDSETGSDPDDPADIGVDPFAHVPGLADTAHNLDDKMTGVSGGAAFLLCRRAARMNSHARQWALPGGRIDTGETAEQAALRERGVGR
jgi:8-oxo-dGTP pyrophosphatase MutT (NUDIX family)